MITGRPLAAAALCCACAAGASGCPGPGAGDAAPPGAQIAFADDDVCAAAPRGPFGDGPFWLQVAPGAAVCTRTGLSPSLPDELDRRARFVLAPADHFLPLDEGAHDADLAVCGAGPRDQYATVFDGARPEATWLVDVVDVFGRDRVRAALSVRLDGDVAAPPPDGGVDEGFTYELGIDAFADQLAAGVRLDERPWPSGAATIVRHRLCRGATCAGATDTRALGACDAAPPATERHQIEHPRGDVDVTLAVAGNAVDVVAASGTLDDVPFEVDPYWHAAARISLEDLYTRELAIDLPTETGACRLHVQRIYPYSSYPEQIVVRVLFCDGEALDLAATVHRQSTITPDE